MSWKKQFTRMILERGRRYYTEGRVEELECNNSFCVADVRGEAGLYHVEINDPGATPQMTCDCPYAMRGLNCKHMAAVMYAWAGKTGNSSKEDTLIKGPVARSTGGLRPYYDIPSISGDFMVTEADLETAKDYVKTGNVAFGAFEEYYVSDDAYWGRHNKQVRATIFFSEDPDIATATATGNISAGSIGTVANSAAPNGAGANSVGPNGAITPYTDPIYIIFDNKAISSYACGVCDRSCRKYYNTYYSPGNYDGRLICTHVAAALLLLDDYTRKFDPGDDTDYKATRVINAFRLNKRALGGTDPEHTRDITLEPRIENKGREYELSFRVSPGGKAFVIKNLTDFYKVASSWGTYPLGKSDKIDFAREGFDEGSEELYHLIEREVVKADALERKMEKRRSYVGGSVEAKRSIPFSGDVIDTIYDEMEGKTVSLKDAGRTHSLSVGSIDPTIEIMVAGSHDANDDNRVFSGIRVSGVVP